MAACAACGDVSYRDPGGTVAPTVALARLFGEFDLVGTLPSIHAPGREVLLYRPPSRKRRRHLDAFAEGTWFAVDDGLWLSHDGMHLLLATATHLPAEVTGA